MRSGSDSKTDFVNTITVFARYCSKTGIKDFAKLRSCELEPTQTASYSSYRIDGDVMIEDDFRDMCDLLEIIFKLILLSYSS